MITHDPDSDWINLGAYRTMILDEKHVSIVIGQGKQGRMHYEKWWAREGRCPVAISLGHDPLLFALAGLEIPLGIGEYDYAGAVMARPSTWSQRLKRGCPFPPPRKRLRRMDLSRQEIQRRPVRRMDRVLHRRPALQSRAGLGSSSILQRKDPILLGAPPGKPPHDYSYMKSVMKSAMIQDALARAGLRGVRGCGHLNAAADTRLSSYP